MSSILGSRWVRLAVAIGLLAWALWKSEPAATWAALLHAQLLPLAGAVGLTLFDRALMAYRWLVLLAPVPPETRPPLVRLMRIFFVSTFVGTFLPASVGSDVVRAYAVGEEGVPLPMAVASVMMDRALGVLSILLLGLAAVVAVPQQAPPGVVTVLVIGALVCVALAFVIFSEHVATMMTAMFDRLPWSSLQRLAHRLLEAVRTYRHHHGALTNVVAGSLGVQVLRVLQAWLLGVALGITVPLSAYFVCIPIILLIMLLPVTMNGIGTSQVAFIWCFGAIGVGRAEAFALSVLFVALGIVGNLPGVVLYTTGGVTRQTA